jgi:hypothetical protein
MQLRRTQRWLAMLPLVAAVLTTGTAAHAAPVAPPKQATSITFTTPTLAVTTTTHRKLLLTVEAFGPPGSPVQSPALIVSLQRAHSDEAHGWIFPLTTGSFVVNRSTIKGSLKTGASQIAPYGLVSLTFTRVGKATTKQCSTTRTVTHRVHVEGIVDFKTHSSGPHSWGNLGSLHRKLTFGGHGTVVVQYGAISCTPDPATAPCHVSVSWSAGNDAGLTIGGIWTLSHGKVRAHIIAQRQVMLTNPIGALRIDSVQTAAPPPALTTKVGRPTLIATTQGSSGASGSVEVISAGLTSPTSHACAKTHHETDEEWSGATYTNGDEPLTVHEQIEGPMALPDMSDAAVINVSRQTS